MLGLAGLSTYIIRFVVSKVWRLVEDMQVLMTNHVAHNTEALTQLTFAIRELRQDLRDRS